MPGQLVAGRNSVAHEHVLAYLALLRRVLKLERGDPAADSLTITDQYAGGRHSLIFHQCVIAYEHAAHQNSQLIDCLIPRCQLGAGEIVAEDPFGQAATT